MAPSAGDQARLRRMTAEPTTAIYSNDAIIEYIERYPLRDSNQVLPDASGWVPTYDLHAAAADIWDEKAAARQDKYDFAADGGNYRRNQAYESAMAKAKWHRVRSSAKPFNAIKTPDEPASDSVYESEFDYEDLE